MNKSIRLPVWLFGLAIAAQFVLAVLTARVIWRSDSLTSAGKWSPDSAEYYKTKYHQEQVNHDLSTRQQQHDLHLEQLDKGLHLERGRIDNLHGDELQREIDRNYNQPAGQPAPTRPQTNPTHRSRGAAGASGPGRTDPPAASRVSERLPVIRAEPGHCCPYPNDYFVEPTPAGERERRASIKNANRRLPEETTWSQTGELDHARGRPAVRGREAKTHLNYWQRIRAQGYTYPDVAFAISAVETGYWYRPSAGNNLFGMKKNQRRLYSSLSATGYCRYADEAASLTDYAGYEREVIAKYGLRSKSDYVAHICKRFCPNPAYEGRLTLAFKKLAQLDS